MNAFNEQGCVESAVTVEGFDVALVDIPFRKPIHLPFGTIESRPSAWLKVAGQVDGVGDHIGLAEGSSIPFSIPLYDDNGNNLVPNISAILSSVAGKQMSFDEIRAMVANAPLSGNFATSRMTVETAVLDMLARSRQASVYELFTTEQGAEPLSIPYGKSIAEIEREKLVTSALKARDDGAKRLKFKISPSTAPEVIEGITTLAEEVPMQDMMVDANGTFNPEDPEDLEKLKKIDALGLLMIEEPVSRSGDILGLDAYRRLMGRLTLDSDVALDDSIMSTGDAEQALEENLGQIVNLKPGRIGSFVTCVEIAERARELGSQVMVGGMYEATPGRSMTLTLAAICLRMGFTIPGDLSLPQENLVNDLVPERLSYDGSGNVRFQPSIGWGYQS